MILISGEGKHGGVVATESDVVVPGMAVCVECLFLRTPSRGPLQDSFGVRQKGGLPGPVHGGPQRQKL